MRAIEDGTGSARLSARLRDLEEQESILRAQLAAIDEPAAAPVYDRDQLIFMLSQFQRGPDEQDEEYKQRLIDTFVHAVYLTDEIAFVQFNITDPEKAESTTLESVMLDLLHGKPIAENPSNSGLSAGFDRVSLGGASATVDEPFKPTVIVFASSILLCIQNISAK